MNTSRRIGVTIGDPTGIGPEVALRALAALPIEARARCVLYGDRCALEPYAELASVDLDSLSIVASDALANGCTPGSPDRAAGLAQVAYLESAVRDAADAVLAGLVTAPISKSMARRAGFDFPGHTEFLAERLEAPRVAMLFAGPRLKVVLATVHVALADVPAALDRRGLVATATLAIESMMRDFGIAVPRVGVLGLNPHAGESGLFGTEEDSVISPAIADLRGEFGARCEIEGPLVPDAAFRSDFDLFVAMYHDQGLIPVKLIDFEEAVNVTLGLPIVRTSPDHGVAYDIAGTGQARPASMLAALRLALRMVDRRAAASEE